MATVRLASLLALRMRGRLPALPRLLTAPLWILTGGPIDPNSVTPSANTVPGAGKLQSITAGIGWWALVLSLIGLFVGAATWAIGSHSNNYQYTSAGKRAVVVSGLAAVVIGAAPFLVNWFFNAGKGFNDTH